MIRVIALLALTITAALAADTAFPQLEVSKACQGDRNVAWCYQSQYTARSLAADAWIAAPANVRSECGAIAARFSDYRAVEACLDAYKKIPK